MDAERRRLDRESAAGDPDARARLLVARLRAGELTRERLALAAMLGDPAARAALAPEAPPEEAGSAAGAALALKPYGPPAYARAALALLPWLDEPFAGSLRPVRAWLEAPAGTAGPRVGPFDWGQVGGVVYLARETVRRLQDGRAPRTGEREHADATVRAAMAAYLVPWALGDGDPALERELPPPVRTFSPAERFAVGERLRHVRFGAGEVVRLTPQGLVVKFGDIVRRLRLRPPS